MLEPDRVTVFALLGRPMSLLLLALLLVIVCPDLESSTLPELSIIRVRDPDAPLLVTEELLEFSALLLYALEDLPLSPDLLLTALLVEPLTLFLDEPLMLFLDEPLTAERPTLDLPLFEVLYDAELLPDLLLLSPE